MATYAIILQEANPAFDTLIQRKITDSNRRKVSPSVWLASSDKLVEAFSDDLGLSEGAYGSVAVLGLSPAYWGYHDTSLWEWLANRSGK
jgi:hypothetical protein